jgi:hypothetical protein
MADYFTTISFIVPVIPAQGDWFAQAHLPREPRT